MIFKMAKVTGMFFLWGAVMASAETSKKIEVSQSVSQVFTGKPQLGKKEPVPADLGALVLKKKTAYLKNGCGFREALGGLVKVYEICMNLKAGKASSWEDSFNSGAKHSFLLTLDFRRGVGGKKVAGAFKESFKKIASSGAKEDLERARFVKWVSTLSVKKKDVFDLLFNDEGKSFKMLYEKHRGDFEANYFESDHRPFAKSVAMIWLGPESISEEIKKNLLK